MLIQTSLALAILSAGVLADRYTTENTKKQLGLWIVQSKTFDWHSYVAQRSWLIYTKVFGSHSRSKRFILTSFVLYGVICSASFAFLAFFFPSTFQSITSVWTYGTLSEMVWWSACMCIGGVLYVLANAQTLYFLEILKTAPNFFRFFLVAYADLLITASIALFGVPALLTTYTLGISYTGSENLALNVDFRPRADGVTTRLEPESSAPSQSAEEDGGTYYVRFGFQHPETDLAEANADYDAVVDAARRGHAPGVQISRGTITYTTATEFIGVLQRGVPYEGTVMSFGNSRRSRDDNLNSFCISFASGALGNSRGQIITPRMDDVARTIYRACRSRRIAAVDIPARINFSEINVTRLYRVYLLVALNDLTYSVQSSFGSYLTASPYEMIRIEDPAQIWNVYTAYYATAGEGRPFDQMIMKAYMRSSGASRLVVNKSLAAGSINVAILSTAIFNLLVMSVFFMVFPIIKLIGSHNWVKRFLTIEKTPFSILSALLALWVSVVLAVLSLI